MSKFQFQYPDAIVSTEWLEDNLSLPDLRIFDCTTYLDYVLGSNQPYEVISGRTDYETAHIPGSGFLDQQGELSDKKSPFLFAMLPAEHLSQMFAQLGIGDNTRVILYSRKNPQWATRVWWMLRSIGFDNAAILDGGWDKWILEERATSSDTTSYRPTQLIARPRPELFTDKAGVQKAIGDPQAVTISALSPDLHSGKNPRYGRPGHIPGSVNVPASSLLNSTTTAFPTAEFAATAFSTVGASPSRQIITYCGSGIWASLLAFLLYQLGYQNIAVYDNSMSEWATDITSPIETD